MRIPPSFMPLAPAGAATHGPGLLRATVALLLLGLVMVYSATISLPDAPRFNGYGASHFLLRQAGHLLAGCCVGYIVLRIPVACWHRYSTHAFLICLAMLALVLAPVIGKDINGARRWLSLPGFALQPSEFMKFGMALYAAGFAVRRHAVLFSLRRGFGPMLAAVSVVGALLLLEPDLGAFAVIVAIAMGVLFTGGVNVVWFGMLASALCGIFALLIACSPWRRARLFAYLDPWQPDHALGKAYQLSHSLIAFGRGEVFGVGLGASIEKLHYLPEAHTDFLLAVIGEELGLAGVLVVVGMFYYIVRACILVGRQAASLDRHFAALAAQGVGIWIGTQAFINMAVAMGLLPTKGLTLPFMSYGGSGILANCLAIALVLRIDLENSHAMFPGSAARNCRTLNRLRH